MVQPEHSPGRLTSNLFRVLREAGPSDSLSEPYEVCTQRQRTGDAGAEPLHVPEAGSGMRQVGTERSRGHRPSPQSGDRQQRQPAPHGCPLTLNSASSAPALAARRETPTLGVPKHHTPGHPCTASSAGDTTYFFWVENGGLAGFRDCAHRPWQSRDPVEVCLTPKPGLYHAPHKTSGPGRERTLGMLKRVKPYWLRKPLGRRGMTRSGS